MAFILHVEGLGNVEITNWDEVEHKILDSIGFQIVTEVKRNIRQMKLIETGDLLTSIGSEVVGNELVVFSTVKYAPYLEYGTLAYWEKYGLENFTQPLHPKKKDMTPEQRKKFPKGMQPFGLFRRVFHNEQKMKEIIQNGFNSI